MHANHDVSFVVLIMFVKTFEFNFQKMIHPCVVRYNDTSGTEIGVCKEL